jgi:hypothetical protein
MFEKDRIASCGDGSESAVRMRHATEVAVTCLMTLLQVAERLVSLKGTASSYTQ